MAWEQPGFMISGFKGATTLSTSQYKYVQQTSSHGASIVSHVNQQVLGLLQNKPTSGMECEIMAFGVSKGRAAAAITQGQRVGPSTHGFVIAKTMASTGGAVVNGVALDTVSAANEIVTVYLNVLPGEVNTS